MKDKICGYTLDEQQLGVVLDNSKYLLVTAGAGSGKTLTILGKIYYLVNCKHYLPSDILCISFTKASSECLREKIKREFFIDIPVYTFHKFALEVLGSSNKNYLIADENLLDEIVYKFFNFDILNSNYYMKLVLRYFNQFVFFDVKNSYLSFLKKEVKMINLFEKKLISFIKLFKGNGFSADKFLCFLREAKKIFNFSYGKEKIFLLLAINIYFFYDTYLKEHSEVDFDDMIFLATNYTMDSDNFNKYRYIIIDEYQDTSFTRFSLINSVLKKTGANLLVVGDDFQSIYRFSGCDLSLFLNFTSFFKGAKIRKLENTYRNSQELVSIAGSFIMKNKIQIEKNLRSCKSYDKPVKVVYYVNIFDDFANLLLYIYKNINTKILVLGRNNNDIFKYTGKYWDYVNNYFVNKSYKFLKFRYMTVHKSKGLEEEVVVIINLEDDILGFPSKIVDDKVFRFVSSSKDNYLYAEERRLFYVALTRTKSACYLFTSKCSTSIFVKELVRDHAKQIQIFNLPKLV